jgi:hypothetical protein
MPIEFSDGFDPLRPDSCVDWERRADEYLRAKVREMREKQPRSPFGDEPDAMSDLIGMFKAQAGDTGDLVGVDGALEMNSEREELVQQILAARKKGTRTGLCDGL